MQESPYLVLCRETSALEECVPQDAGYGNFTRGLLHQFLSLHRPHKGKEGQDFVYTPNSSSHCSISGPRSNLLSSISLLVPSAVVGSSPLWSGELVVIELDNNEGKSHDKGAYVAFKEAVKVEDYEASYIEAL